MQHASTGPALILLLCSAGLGGLGQPASQPPVKPVPPAHDEPASMMLRVSPERLIEARKAAFSEQILLAAREYRTYERVSDRANWSPMDCMLRPPAGIQESRSKDDQTHGRKLYYLYAKDAAAYHEMSMHGLFEEQDPAKKQAAWENPIGQVVVKEAFAPVEMPAGSDGEKEGDKAARERTARLKTEALPDVVESEGKLYHAGDPAGLFVMIKLDPKTEGTDNGWIYGTTSADAKTVLQVGRVESCMKCHVKTERDRLYGHRRSWRVEPDGEPAAGPTADEKSLPVKAR